MSAPRQYAPVERVDDGPLVFIVQNQHRYDAERRVFVPKFDLEPARVFGDFVELVSPTANPFNSDSIVPELNFKLGHYRDGDFLLAVGNPMLIGAAFAIASIYNDGRVTGLQWSGKDRRYIPVHWTNLGD